MAPTPKPRTVTSGACDCDNAIVIMNRTSGACDCDNAIVIMNRAVKSQLRRRGACDCDNAIVIMNRTCSWKGGLRRRGGVFAV